MAHLDNRPSIRSAWPTPIGKKLTDRKISLYKKQGYYKTNLSSSPTPRRDSAPTHARIHKIVSEFV
jgi:hypothetical protein